MGKVLKDSQGKVLLTGGNAIEVTSSIDSNIQAGNIKKDVTILGVTGTYEGSGGSNVISFTVRGNFGKNTYQAEKDMTWQEWMNSTYYNSSYNFSITSEGYVMLGINNRVISPDYYTYTGYPSEYGSSVIKSNRAYLVSGGGDN